MSLGIKKGDKVTVISGKDKGKIGKVLTIIPADKRIIVEGINVMKKHLRRRSEAEPGGVREVPMAINASKVLLFCPTCGRGVRFSTEVSKDKSKVRICKKCQKPI